MVPDEPNKKQGDTHAEQRIGLALSGGGFRASIFHLGVIRRLEELGIMHKVAVISAVSGGSIVAAYYACEMERQLRLGDSADWTNPQKRLQAYKIVASGFLEKVRLNMRSRALVFTPFYHPWLFVKSLALRSFRQDARSVLIQAEFDAYFYDNHTLDQLPAAHPGSERKPSVEEQKRAKDCKETIPQVLTGPKLLLNTTSLMTGERKAFSRDANTYLAQLKTSNKNVLKLSQVVGASSGTPVLFPPTAICGELLVDGGVSDNQGLDGLLPLSSPRSRGKECPPPDGYELVDVLLVSDASGQLEWQHRLSTGSVSVFSRVTEILQHQVRNKLLDRLGDAKHAKQINFAFVHLYLNLRDDGEFEGRCVPSEFIEPLARIRTDLDQFSYIEAEMLMYHGYTLIDAMVRRWCREGLLPQCNDQIPPLQKAPLFRDVRDPKAAGVRTNLIQDELAAGSENIFLFRCWKKFGWRRMLPIYLLAVLIWLVIEAYLFSHKEQFVQPFIDLWKSWLSKITLPGGAAEVVKLIKSSLETIVTGAASLAGALTVLFLPGYIVVWALWELMRPLALMLDRRRYRKITGGSDPESIEWNLETTRRTDSPEVS